MMNEIKIDDDDDMSNPYNVEFGLDDIYDDLYEEDDEFHWSVWGIHYYVCTTLHMSFSYMLAYL